MLIYIDRIDEAYSISLLTNALESIMKVVLSKHSKVHQKGAEFLVAL